MWLYEHMLQRCGVLSYMLGVHVAVPPFNSCFSLSFPDRSAKKVVSEKARQTAAKVQLMKLRMHAQVCCAQKWVEGDAFLYQSSIQVRVHDVHRSGTALG